MQKGVGKGYEKQRALETDTPPEMPLEGVGIMAANNVDSFRSWSRGYGAGLALTAARFQVCHDLEKIRTKHEPNTDQKQFDINESASKRQPKPEPQPSRNTPQQTRPGLRQQRQRKLKRSEPNAESSRASRARRMHFLALYALTRCEG